MSRLLAPCRPNIHLRRWFSPFDLPASCLRRTQRGTQGMIGQSTSYSRNIGTRSANLLRNRSSNINPNSPSMSAKSQPRGWPRPSG